MQGAPIDSNTAISVGMLIAIIGGVIRITVLLTQLKTELGLHKETPRRLEDIGRDVASTKGRVAALEDDVNNLWAFAVSDDPARLFGRLRRGPRSKLLNHDEDGGEDT